MTDPAARHSLGGAARREIERLGSGAVRVVDAEPEGERTEATLRAALGERYRRLPTSDPDPLAAALRAPAPDGVTFLFGPATQLIGPAYSSLRALGTPPAPRLALLASHAGLATPDASEQPAMGEDIGVARGVPGLTVLVPGDAPSAAAAVRIAATSAAPVYVRLTRERLPTTSDEELRLAKARTLRDGSDLAIVAIGAMLPPAIELARALGRVGVAVRVVDLASVKPFDEPALLRAARDTGAILTLEEHSVATGIGSLVASVTAERHPVPVRRLGIPDVGVVGGTPAATFGVSADRLLEEAYELLRLRGKVE